VTPDGSELKATRSNGARVGDVAAALEELIFAEFVPGSSLPSEADLALRLGVSRLTLREAAKSLQARGLLTVSKGRRPVVAHLTSGPVGDFFGTAVRRDPRRLLDLLEIRQALEVQSAALAAARVSRASLAALEASLAAMKEGELDAVAFNEADLQFHESLAGATGNQMLIFLIEALADPLHTSRMQSYRGHLARGRGIAEVIEEHAKILECVRAQDQGAAMAAMRDHLASTERDLRAGLPTTNGE